MKKVVLVLVGIVILAFLITFISGNSLVIPFNEVVNSDETQCVNEKLNPFDKFDFSKGDWKIYIVLSSDDKSNLPSKVRKVNCFKSSNSNLLNNLKEKWDFECKGGDMATVDSDIYLFQDGKLVFTSGLMIGTNQEGLQSQNFGWIFSKDKLISNSLEKFDRVYSPLIFL